ncbi:lysylphosphatidylglycerol synthase transmembrane domain-containing protein [Nakamurella panacisegetis]|uniref:lysylphosphatidylglycerol synthase transmembrane domain-containing protein n=1 Tax=Nakamurella panacisegetis TaxID=1090615 RepID=UPI000B851B82|nr:lysylphosphatidylglycerol synthase transmembrane domain-containing protein [Nakamurella panacisegetis]
MSGFSLRRPRRPITGATDGSPRSFWPAARIRRPLDIGRLVLTSGLLAVVLTVAPIDLGQLRAIASLLPTVRSGLPRIVLAIANVAVSVAVFGALTALVVDAVRSRRLALTSAAMACVTGLVMAFGLGLLLRVVAGDEIGRLLTGPWSGSAGLAITAVIALLVGSDPHGRRGWVAARVSVAGAVACDLALGSLTVPSLAYAALVGAAAGFAVRVAVGVVPARPPEEVLRAVLADADLVLTALTPLEQAAGRIRYTGVGPDVGEVRVTVVDPDRGGVPFVRRIWRLLRLRTAVVGRPALTLRGQLERQALTAGLAKAAGVPAPEVLALLAAGPALVLVERPLVGVRISACSADEAGRAVAAAFVALRRLHGVGVAHGAVTAEGIRLLPDGGAGFADFSLAQPATTELQRGLDVAALLVVTAAEVGADAAVAALRATYALTPATEARLAALLQPVVLPPPLRREVRRTPRLGEVREAIIGPGGLRGIVGAPRLERLRPRTVLSIVGGTVAVYLLATQLSRVSIGAAIRAANPGWLAVAVVGSALTYLGSAVALQAFVSTRLPLGRTVFAQLAASFVALVTPPAVGHVGLNIRYLQKSGLSTATATADVAVKELVTVIITVPLLLICGWLSGVSGSRLALLPSGTVLAILGATAAVMAVIALAPPTRRLLRRRLEPLIRRTLPQLITTLSDPKRLATALVGVLVLNGGYVLALDASLRAFSTSLGLPTLVVVYLAASTLGSAAPTPGGLGAIEAALVAGLTAAGVPVGASITAVLAFRAATFWLPAPLGWGAFVMLQRRSRI